MLRVVHKSLCACSFEEIVIQNCDSVFAPSMTQVMPLHLSLENAIFRGLKKSNSDVTLGTRIVKGSTPINENSFEGLSGGFNYARKKSSKENPMDIFNDLYRSSLDDLLHTLKDLKSFEKLRQKYSKDDIVCKTLRILIREITLNEDLSIMNQNKSKSIFEKVSSMFHNSNPLSVNHDSLREGCSYANIRKLYFTKCILHELTKLGCRSSFPSHLLLRTLLINHSYFLFDPELLHKLTKFGAFDIFKSNLTECDQWKRFVLRFFADVSLMRAPTPAAASLTYSFPLGNIVQYYLVLQEYDTHHELLSQLFKRIDDELEQKGFPSSQDSNLCKATLETKHCDTIINKISAQSIDGITLTTKDIYTLLAALQKIRLDSRDTSVHCTYFLLISHIHKILQSRARIEIWDLQFLADCTDLMVYVKRTADRLFSHANAYFIREMRTVTSRSTVFDALTKKDKCKMRMIRFEQQRLHNCFQKFVDINVLSELISLASVKVSYDRPIRNHLGSSPRHENPNLNPIALVKIFTVAVKLDRKPLALHVAHRLLHSHCSFFRSGVYTSPWARRGVTYLCAFLRFYCIAREGSQTNDDARNFFDELLRTWSDIHNDFNDESHLMRRNDLHAIPYLAFVLHRYHFSANIHDEITQLFQKIKMEKSALDSCETFTQEGSVLILWILFFLKTGEPRRGVAGKNVKNVISSVVNEITSIPFNTMSIFSQRVLREIVVHPDIFSHRSLMVYASKIT